MKPRRYGWKPDLPDHRDHLYSVAQKVLTSLPAKVDLRSVCPPVYDQHDLGSCHDAATEVLTDHGFKLFSALDGSERLATVDPSTAALSFEMPTRIVRFPYRGELHCVANESLNFKVTPDHKMLVRKWNERARTLNEHYEFVAAKDVGRYAGLMNRIRWNGEIHGDTFTLPGIDHKHMEQRTPKEIPMRAWVRFLGIYLAEGTMLKRDQRKGSVSYKVQIAASKEIEKAFVREVLAEIGVHALELADRFTFQNRRIYEAMSSLGLEGVHAGDKFVPAFIMRLSSEMIGEFLEGHFAGDGCLNRELRSHYTGSVRLASDLQTLAFMSGNESRISIRAARTSMTADGRTIRGVLPEHRVSVCERKNLSIHRQKQWFTEEYDGEVFCAEVPTHHTLVTRREGKILVSGNCTANAIAAAIEFDRKRQNLSDFTPSRLFIYYCERALEGTVSEDAGAQIRDGIKSVASLGACEETLWPYVENQFAVKPPSHAYASAKLHPALRYQRLTHSPSILKGCLAQGTPISVGISVYESFESEEVAKTGIVPMPHTNEDLLGGHAVLVVGYDDAHQRFIVRNSWGSDWGQAGYFELPYAYLLNPNLADDFWAIQLVK